ncbi:peptide deformylase [Pseudonocardia adelaidensis]|uniref:Peptide deformylase n=1 Tax=Pseudonocardia adelaidensis TaxID=648754 RepID=A0ABP9P6L2_9PSEU
MAVRPIRIIGDPVRHRPTRLVETFDDDLKTLVEEMCDTMAAADGVGLAARLLCTCGSARSSRSRPCSSVGATQAGP